GVLAISALLAFSCGQDSSSGMNASAGDLDGGNTGHLDGGGFETGVLPPPVPTPSGFFDKCGGKIVDPNTGAIDPVEYGRQARAWDLATIDCRLGPKFADVHPDQSDPRPTMYQPPKKPVPVPSSAHLDTYQLGSYAAPSPSEPNPAYGVVIGHG